MNCLGVMYNCLKVLSRKELLNKMKKELATKRIRKAVEQACPNESEQVKQKLVDFVYSDFMLFETDSYDEHTSNENLNYAITINLEDSLEDLLDEFRNN